MNGITWLKVKLLTPNLKKIMNTCLTTGIFLLTSPFAINLHVQQTER